MHLEFRYGYRPKATGQRRGNSGVYLQGRYEVQILDSYDAKGGLKDDCGAIYDCEVSSIDTEFETGKRADRPELAKALAHAKRSKATLVVAKLDRLARNVAFLSRLMEAGCDFIAIDLEHANRLTIHILSAVAEGEAKAISDRTKTALQAAKARGTQLGSARPGHWEGRESSRLEGSAKGAAAAVAHKTAADEAYTDLMPIIKKVRAEEKTFQQVADALNDQGHTTRRGKPWNHVQVIRVLGRVN